MTKTYKVLRAVVVSLLVIAVGVPVGLYIVLSTPWAQNELCEIGERELSKLLGTDVSIGSVSFSPFDRVVLGDVSVKDDFGRDALTVEDLSLRFEIGYFLRQGKLAFDYVSIDRMNAWLYKPSADAPLNIDGIIKHLQPKDKTKPPTRFELAIATVEIRNSSFRYDILDAPSRKSGFDARHIHLSGLELNAYLPKVTNEGVSVDLQHLAFKEKSGLQIDDFTASATVMPGSVKLTNPVLLLPGSRIMLNSFAFAPEKLSELAALGRTQPVEVKILPGSYVTLSDAGWAVEALKDVDRRFNIDLDAGGVLSDMSLTQLRIVEDGGRMFKLNVSGHVTGLPSPDSLYVDGLDLKLHALGSEISDLTHQMADQLGREPARMLAALGDVNLDARVSGSLRDIIGQVDLQTSLGSVRFDGRANLDLKAKAGGMDARVDVADFNLGRLLAQERFGNVSLKLDASIDYAGRRIEADGKLDVASFVFNGNDFCGVSLEGHYSPDRSFEALLNMDNALGLINLECAGSAAKGDEQLTLQATLRNVDLTAMGLKGKYEGYRLGLDIDGDISGSYQDWVNGVLSLRDIDFVAPTVDKPSLHIKNLSLDADNFTRPSSLTVTSDFFNGSIEGDICLRTLGNDVRTAVGSVLPVFAPTNAAPSSVGCQARENRFIYQFELAETEQLCKFFNLPIKVIYPVSLDGSMDMPAGKMTVSLDAPYLLNGEKIIENTALQAELFVGDSPSATLYTTTQMPTKKGEMVLVGEMTAANNRVDTRVDWMLEREIPINGSMSLSTLLGRTESGALTADVNFNPCDINFGTDTWHIAPSQILYRPDDITVDNFVMTAGEQRIAIDGRAAADPESALKLDLKDIDLIAIFETLDINKALIGGRATGVFDARALLSPQPQISCADLHVDSISYNYCVLGNAEVRADWDNEAKSVLLDADVVSTQGRHSHIYGNIVPAEEKLDISFDADQVPVGFLKPFMSAFADDVTGTASGHARLFGTFKYIDLEGDIQAHDFGLKIGFTNTWFYCSDRVKITPGSIAINNATVRDANGNTAMLSGWVKHKFFKEPSFDFRLTEAHNFLSYDVTPKLSPDWYGRIYGNGSAFITGHPGVVNIDVNMSTAPGSTFTFVLSDMEEADEYTFITFRDRGAKTVITDSIIEVDHIPQMVRDYQRRMAQANADEPSDYNMNIQVDITRDANIVVVMDPVGGDEIKASGAGSLRMTYRSAGNDLRMYGTYTIERGSYNFTLQDIIVKDFKIREGSSIAFTGDPYSARLNIAAIYQVNANLSDLDESFLQDKDLNRTNVPVNALLKVSGDMRQPDISFDLEFPTLTSDTYRKVRSIVSTDEMMNRQIIYLLALGRFYTPDYMAGATKGNELFSVASSTIGSQLTSMLGKLSPNWTIAPNLRSDRGDFSDVEFDLALSSTLLNNRLRLNGNFGYRDKSLNTNQFIGDFDIEYLLNRSGSWRLKAYNRYNDQNYYLRTAQTTQGVGIMFRRDFDKMFNFLRPKKKKKPLPGDNRQAPADSLRAPADSLKNDSNVIENQQ